MSDSPAIWGGVPSPLTRATPDSPVRERGAPSRSRASLREALLVNQELKCDTILVLGG
jgi:hypothetical protein